MKRVLISPNKYIQGSGELSRIKENVEHLGKTCFVLISKSGYDRFGTIINDSFGNPSNLHFEYFNGECSKKEIERLKEEVDKIGANVIIGVGGGKIHDTSKAVAYYKNIPVVIVPTIASTDAPCSALSVIYTEEGQFEEYLFLPKNPDVVLIDSDIVANAPSRLLVAGMGDALATKFEARAAVQSGALAMAGGLPTAAALALADLCYETLITEGLKAKLAIDRKVVTKSVDKIIEANTLLSGIGFESGGLSAAHAIHNGLTAIEEIHHLYHGEKVAFGVLVQLVLENAPIEELNEVLNFCYSVGLPITLKDLGIVEISEEKIMEVAELSCVEGETIHNMPFKVNSKDVYAAIMAADAIGENFKES